MDSRDRLSTGAGPACGADALAALLGPTDRLAVGGAGTLLVAGEDATALVRRFGSPLQVVVEDTLRANYRRLAAVFRARWPAPVNVMYAIKCNNALAVRAVMSEEGAGGDCFGLGELYASLAGGADPALIAMNGSNKSLDEVAAAVALGVAVNVDGADEIGFLTEAVQLTGKRARVNLRLKVLPEELDRYITAPYRTAEGFVAGVRGVKWGYTPDAAVPLIAALRALPDVELLGYSAHVGHLSNRPEAFAALAGALAGAARRLGQQTGFRPAVLDIGGGWAQLREPSSREPALNPYTIEDYAEAATAALRAGLGDGAEAPALWLEPGRYITSNAAVLLTTVGAVKRDLGLSWAHVDASTNDLPRIESGRHWYHILPASRMHAPLAESVEIVGSTCFKSVLGSARPMPALERGDLLAVLDTGMYAEVFANQFNGVPRPAAVMLSPDGVALIKRRETVADVFATQLMPEWLARRAPAHAAAEAVLGWAERGYPGSDRSRNRA